MPKAGCRQKESPAAFARRTLTLLRLQHPSAGIELHYRNHLELLVAVILSAQCTDRRVNQVTPGLFQRFTCPEDYLAAPPGELERYLRPLGFFRQKARFIRDSMALLNERYGGQVPRRMEDLLLLPGVGRKTANVILSNAFGIAAGIAVDTHVRRVSRRLGWTEQTDPDRIEQDLLRLFPRRSWPHINHVMVIHGRYICRARRPDCANCRASRMCPSSTKENKEDRGKK